MNPCDLSIEMRSDPRLLRPVRALIHSYLETEGVNEDRAQDIVLAVDEACTNSIRHAYEGKCDCLISVRLNTTERFVEITVCDGGIPASPDAVAKKQVEKPDRETLMPGGLGVQLMYAAVDEVEFQPGTEKGNCVIMRLKRPVMTENASENAEAINTD